MYYRISLSPFGELPPVEGEDTSKDKSELADAFYAAEDDEDALLYFLRVMSNHATPNATLEVIE
jgi:hypothetical protein